MKAGSHGGAELRVLSILFISSLFALLFCPLIGQKMLSFQEVLDFSSETVDLKVFWQMRVPRVLVAFMVGATFSVTGMVFQALFRNPLVSPFTLGVSAGAAFGAAVYIWSGLTFALIGISGISIFSFFGGLLSLIIVWSLARREQNSSTAKILLAGVAVSFFFVSLIMFVQYLSDANQSVRISRWLMGGLFVFGYGPVLDLLPFALVCLFAILYFTHELNLLTTGEEMAASRGVNIRKTIILLFVLCSLIIGGVVAVSGPITFIGIVAPHICRLLIGPNHRYLTPASFLFGGFFLTICDTFARTVIAPAEIPVGVITALIGGPFFLWLLQRRYSE